jgi:uncharacterized protein (DUF58 family)
LAWTGDPTRLTKLAYGERLVAALSLLLLRQRDAVGLIRYDSEVRTVIPPRARGSHWRRILAALTESGSGVESRTGAALARAARLVRRAGMVVLVSDLLMDVDEVESAVRALRAVGHDVTVLHLMDPTERDLAFGGRLPGEAVFVDPESGEHVPAALADVRSAYRATVDAAVEEWRTVFSRAGASYVTISTDSAFGVPLRLAFAARQALF